MSSKIIGTLLLLSQVVCGNDNEASTPLASESSREVEAEGDLPSTEESPAALVDLHNESSSDKSLSSFTDQPPEVRKEGEATEEENTIVDDKEELPSDSHTSNPNATDTEASTPLASESSREVEAEGDLPSTEESPAALVDLHNESSSDKSLSSFTDQPPEVRKEGEATEEENTIVDDKEELPSDSHNSNPDAKDIANTSRHFVSAVVFSVVLIK
ncbi:hypothetical protein SprV_0602229200 [Sparganum proliferum]